MILKVDFFLLVLCGLMFVGCQDSNRLLDENTVFENQQWNQNQIISFDFEIEDATQNYEFSLNLRNSMTYLYRNLYFLYSIKDESWEFGAK